jgi:hypothetical protein
MGSETEVQEPSLSFEDGHLHLYDLLYDGPFRASLSWTPS